MFNVNFSFVHELDQAFDVFEFTIFHYDNGILFDGTICQNRIEECTTRAQHHTVCFQRLTFAGQSHVTETAPIEQLGKHVLQITVMIFPT